MGYTHYWSFPEYIRSEDWRHVAEFARYAIIEAKREGIKLVREFNEIGIEPEINGEYIQFNGPNEDGHETFLLTREACEFNFCKTALKPYDSVVEKILCFALKNVPGFDYENDGNKR
jgi:hypothetical protein